MKSIVFKIAFSLFLLSGLYNLWTLRPVNILYTYSDAWSEVFLVVDHMPWTDRDKIYWYVTHQSEIKRKNPLFSKSPTYNIIDIGNGFTNFTNHGNNAPEDLLCFPTIKSKNNCVFKNYVLVINEYPYHNPYFYILSNVTEDVYKLTADNKIENVYLQWTTAE